MPEPKSPFARQGQQQQRSPFARQSTAPARRGQGRSASTEVVQFLNELNRNFPGASELQAGLEVGKETIGEVMGGRPISPVGKKWKRARENQNTLSQDFNVRRPNVAAFTRGTAQAAPLVVTGGNAAALPAAGRAVNVARGATAAVAGGAANRAVIGQGTLQERAARASDPRAIALDATLGGVAGNFVPRVPSNRKRISPEAQALVRENVQLTPGQALGGNVRRFEDAATSVPIVGYAVGEAKKRSVDSFNRVAADRALRPVGERLSPTTEAGSDAILEVGERLGQRYQDIVPQVGLDMADPDIATQLAGLSSVTAQMTGSTKDQLENIIKEVVTKKIGQNGRLTGETFKRIESELGQRAGQFTKSPNVSEQDIGNGLNFVLQSLRDGLGRQNPSYAKALADTNKGYSRLATLETAAGRAGNVGSIATPKQLREAFRMGDKSVRKRATAQGRRPDQAFYDAGASVLPSQFNSSGTAERLMGNPLAAVGGLTAGTMNPAIGIPAALTIGAGAGAYSKPAMDLFNRALAKNVSRRDAEIALEKLGALAAQNPKLRALYEGAAIRLGYGSQQPAPTNAMANPQF
jgi:hypothetical protein